MNFFSEERNEEKRSNVFAFHVAAPTSVGTSVNALAK